MDDDEKLASALRLLEGFRNTCAGASRSAIDTVFSALQRRDAQIKRLVTALRSQGLDQYFIDALLDVEGKS